MSLVVPRPPYPLHESVKDKLHPQYVHFYNRNIIDSQQVHYRPVAASRTSGVLLPGAGPSLLVAKIEDHSIERTQSKGPKITVRCFTPLGERPAAGWPVMIYYHGGGWVLGDVNTENNVCTHMCNRASCVVVDVDYRLAPENPFPAAVQDSWEAVLWTQTKGATLLSLDLSKQAIGGSSAGGNLTAAMCHRASSAGGPTFLTQLLIVPVMDNTSLPSNNQTWRSCEFTPALPAEKMLWYRRHYLPHQEDWVHPDASPLLSEHGWETQPPALVVVGELDVLRAEGEAYARKLREAGVKTELHVMHGMPHPFLAMDGVLTAGAQTITYMCETLTSAFRKPA
ncbi:MAG: hypothetical protein M1818_005290 [Claussenomyces sp. TS43310]|nr:MAG: hypothetical protein M1818_005290 [Claussenomyces sp. TS43310]